MKDDKTIVNKNAGISKEELDWAMRQAAGEKQKQAEIVITDKRQPPSNTKELEEYYLAIAKFYYFQKKEYPCNENSRIVYYFNWCVSQYGVIGNPEILKTINANKRTTADNIADFYLCNDKYHVPGKSYDINIKPPTPLKSPKLRQILEQVVDNLTSYSFYTYAKEVINNALISKDDILYDEDEFDMLHDLWQTIDEIASDMVVARKTSSGKYEILPSGKFCNLFEEILRKLSASGGELMSSMKANNIKHRFNKLEINNLDYENEHDIIMSSPSEK